MVGFELFSSDQMPRLCRLKFELSLPLSLCLGILYSCVSASSPLSKRLLLSPSSHLSVFFLFLSVFMHLTKSISLRSKTSECDSTASKPKSYRPNYFRRTSVLFILLKSFERHIHKYYILFIENCSLFHPAESGFRRFH